MKYKINGEVKTLGDLGESTQKEFDDALVVLPELIKKARAGNIGAGRTANRLLWILANESESTRKICADTFDTLYQFGKPSMKKIKIGRHINGISLNPLEYILDRPDGEIMWFNNKEKAVEFLKEAGAKDNDIYWYRFVDEDGHDIDDTELMFEKAKKEKYFIGVHDLGTFPDILLVIEYEGETCEIPFTPRTYHEITREEFLANNNELEIRRINQTTGIPVVIQS